MVIRLAEEGWSFNDIALMYQAEFGTKQKLSRESIRMSIALKYPSAKEGVEFWKNRQKNVLRRIRRDKGKQAEG